MDLGARRVRYAAALAPGHGGYRNAFATLLQEPAEALGKLNAHIEEMYSGNTEVKSFTREDAAIDEFNARNGEYFAQAWKAQFPRPV